MREILFRGKSEYNGEWIFGSLHIEYGETDKDGNRNLDHRILGMRGECDYVIPGTVGQFTGLIDENGKKIFEGDIVHVHDCLVRCDAPFHEFDGVVEHRNASFVIVDDFITHYRWIDYDVTVIGNIHDNPELLEGE